MPTPCYIVDIDGTIADASHRMHHIAGEFDNQGMVKPKDWDAFFDACVDDEPIPHMVRLMDALVMHEDVLLVTGRSDRVRDLTEAWLKKYNICHEKLYMRKAGDHRPDDVVKSELLDQILADGYQPVFAFDDRNRVVKMWRERGVPCAQVADGDF